MSEEHFPLTDFTELPPEEMRARAEAFLEELKRRHTIRDFSDKPVDRAVIEAAIETASRAPSGANHQPWQGLARQP